MSPRLAIAASLALSLPAIAAHRTDAPAEADEVVVVTADPLERFDGTRWLVELQVVLPWSGRIQVQPAAGIEGRALDLRAVVACEKTWRIGPAWLEASCAFEQVALDVAVTSPIPRAVPEEQLALFSAWLRQGRLELAFGPRGRMIEAQLEGVPRDRWRDRDFFTTVQPLAKQLARGFDVARVGSDVLAAGSAVELDTAVFALPIDAPPSCWTQSDGLCHGIAYDRDPPLMAASTLARRVVRSGRGLAVAAAGRGALIVGDVAAVPLALTAVTVLDERERAVETTWTLRSHLDDPQSAAGHEGYISGAGVLGPLRRGPPAPKDPSGFGEAFGPDRGFQQLAGRLRRLGADEVVDLGPSRIVRPIGTAVGSLPPWRPLDGDTEALRRTWLGDYAWEHPLAWLDRRVAGLAAAAAPGEEVPDGAR